MRKTPVKIILVIHVKGQKSRPKRSLGTGANRRDEILGTGKAQRHSIEEAGGNTNSERLQELGKCGFNFRQLQTNDGNSGGQMSGMDLIFINVAVKAVAEKAAEVSEEKGRGGGVGALGLPCLMVGGQWERKNRAKPVS